MFQGLNWVGVIAALVVGQAVSWAWYALLFAKAMTEPMSPAAKTPLGYAEAALFQLVMLIGLAWVIRRTNRDSLTGGAMTGAFLWFAFPLMGMLMDHLFIGRDLREVEIDAGYALVFFAVGGALIGGLKLGRKAAA